RLACDRRLHTNFNKGSDYPSRITRSWGSYPRRQPEACCYVIYERAFRGTKAGCPSRSAEWRRVGWWSEEDMSPTGGGQWLCSPRQVATPSQTPVRYRTQTSASGLSARLLPSSSTPSSRSPPPSPTSWPSLIPNVLGEPVQSQTRPICSIEQARSGALPICVCDESWLSAYHAPEFHAGRAQRPS